MITLNTKDNLSIKSSTKALIKASICIVGTDTTLPITIEGEFKDIPTHLHQIYLQSMQASYGDVRAYDNTKTQIISIEPKTIKEKKKEWRLNKIVDYIMKKIN
jgi:hypothetical protein